MEIPGASAELLREPVFGGRVTLYRAGRREGPAVLLIHGLGQNGARDWGKLIPALAASHDVYALDLPGFGQSDKGNHLYSPANFARVIEAVVAARVARPFALIGHSMGAAAALEYAATYPQRIDRLILVDVAGVLHRAVYAEFLSRLGAQAAGVYLEDAPWFTSFVRTVLTRAERLPFSGSERILSIPQVRQQVLRGDPNAIAAYALIRHDFSRALRSVTAPTLVIWGSDDSVAPLRTGQMAAATIPNARLTIIRGAGHAPMFQAPERFNAIVLEELEGKLQAAPYALQKAPPEGAKVGVCDGERGQHFIGDYKEIRLDRCADAQITQSRVGLLLARDSTVKIVNSHIDGGIEAKNSRLELTAGSVAASAGRLPLHLDASGVDAAGTRFESEGAIAENRGAVAVALFLSVAETVRAGKTRYVHEVIPLAPRARW
jgi:pimeloyl-ACP methyl ester carboxylesterase